MARIIFTHEVLLVIVLPPRKACARSFHGGGSAAFAQNSAPGGMSRRARHRHAVFADGGIEGTGEARKCVARRARAWRNISWAVERAADERP